MIGERLQGRYRVIKRIGKGGFATVYSGFDESLERPVAIKFLEEVEGAGHVKERFLREAKAMAKLSHSNIVTVFDSAEHNEHPYMVMELVNGPTLLTLVKISPPTLPQVCAIAAQTCSGMKYAHDRGVVHRDLTLRNIMVNESKREGQQVKILDFGLAKLLHDEAHTTGKATVATVYYMAPEQIRNEPVDGRVDIFAFGVGLYRMLNGCFPFEAEFPAALMYSILNKSDIPFADEVPAGFRDVIMRCLEKDPQNRYRDFGELMQDIEVLHRSCKEIHSGTTSKFKGLSAYADRHSKRNPYLNRVMITHPSEFFGREREIRRIYSRLDAPRPQSISVVGERRIGKSSLLYHVYHPKSRRTHMRNQENTIFAYLDFQQSLEFDVPRFIDFLFDMFSYEGKSSREYTNRERTLDELKNVVHEINEEGKRIVILMDEFEVITKNPRFDEQFFSFLRALANAYRVAYVTSSKEDLQKMCHNKEISDSPFFNIFANLILRPFSRDEALDLITVPSKTEGIPLEPHAPGILEMAGHFPLFLQIACSAAFEALVANPDAALDWGHVREVFMEEADPHYRSVWEHFDEPSRDNLTRLAAGRTISRKYAYVNDNLIRRGYVVESDEGLSLCSTSFRDFVIGQTTKGKRKGLFGSLLKRRE
jgi:serine/threonine protein kinase